MTSRLIQTVLNDPSIIDAYHDDEKFTLGVDLAKENIECPLRDGIVFRPKTDLMLPIECFGNKISHVEDTLYLDDAGWSILPVILGVMNGNGFRYAIVNTGYCPKSAIDHIFWTSIRFAKTLDRPNDLPPVRLDVWPVARAILPEWYRYIKKIFYCQKTRTMLLEWTKDEANDEGMTLNDLATFLFRNEWMSFCDEKYPKVFYNDDNGFRHEVDISGIELRLYQKNPWPEMTGLHALLHA